MMDGRGGCCIARYGGGYHDMSKVDRIMLRYRPIAPKPVAAGGIVCSGGSPVDVKNGRPKRRYVRENKNNSSSNSNASKRGGTRKRKASPEKASSGGSTGSGGSSSGKEAVVTLPLLSETPERKDPPARVCTTTKKAPIWLSFDRREIVSEEVGFVGGGGREVMVPQPVRLIGSCVTVECVTDTWVEGSGLGRNDEERVMNLERDTCPGFVSDGYNGVRWANKAYKEMVGQEDGGEMIVWLVWKESVKLPVMSEAFTCRVRVTCRKDRSCSLTLTLPCDAWRMDNGGFAWRLDINAALCLGR